MIGVGVGQESPLKKRRGRWYGETLALEKPFQEDVR
jgi:hypothetical protein